MLPQRPSIPIDYADDEDAKDRVIEKAQIPLSQKRNVDNGGTIARNIQGCQIQRRNQNLSENLLPGRKTQIPFFDHFDIIVKKADQAEQHSHYDAAEKLHLFKRIGKTAVR